MNRYVQYGCGFTAPKEWINYDASPTLRFERIPLIGKLYTRNAQRFPSNVNYGDIVKGLPEPSNSADGIYCSHILEHLVYTDFVKALNHTYNILKPGGLFRGVVPDMRAAAIEYLDHFDFNEAPSSQLMRSTMLGVEDRDHGLIAAMKAAWGNSKHLWMWDYKSLHFELTKAGFVDIKEAKFNDSVDPYFKLVEEEGRFYKAAAFECRK